MSVDDFDRRLRDAKLESLAEFAAGAGHEINNPVATILGRAQLLLKGESDPGRRRSLATIAGQALRIRDMIGDLMLFARPPEPQPVWCDLTEIAREAVGPLIERAVAAGASLTIRAGGRVPAFGDSTHLAVAITALIENALNAVSAGGSIEIAAFEEQGVAVLTVRDDGAGFTDQDREHAFDPFYSGRQAGRGLGFGLPKVWRIMTLAGGSVAIASRPGETVVRLECPHPVTEGGSA